MASRVFDRQTRERAWLLYAWCRHCDDVMDGQDHGNTMSGVNGTDAAIRLATITDLTERALRGETTGVPAFDGLGQVVAECAIPYRLPRDLIAGFAMDAQGFAPDTEADLLRYCYHVAGVVGLMMAVIMGVDTRDEETVGRACDLGLAFQLANIARDVREDETAGRCYLPRDWQRDCSTVEIVRRLAILAQGFEESARIGARRLPFRSRWAVLAAAGIYGDIAREVVRRGEKAWEERVATSLPAKIVWVARAFVQALRN